MKRTLFSLALLVPCLVFAQAARPAATASKPIVHTPAAQKRLSSPPLPARVYTIPEGTEDREGVRPKSQSVVLVGRDTSALLTQPEQGTVLPGRIPLSTVVAVDFDIDYDRFEVSKAMAGGEWAKAVIILRKAYTPFSIYLDVPDNNVLEGSYDLGVTMMKSARALMRKATTDAERDAAMKQYAAASAVFSDCAKAKWSSFGPLSLLRSCRCLLAIDVENARRAARIVNALEEPDPGDDIYGHYWLVKAELAKLAGNTTNELDAAVKSLAFENKDVETFPDALMLSAECYEKIGNFYRARDVYFEVAKLFPRTDWSTDAIAALTRIMESGATAKKEDATAESTFFGLEEDMNALAEDLIAASKNVGTIFEYDEEEAAAADLDAK